MNFWMKRVIFLTLVVGVSSGLRAAKELPSQAVAKDEKILQQIQTLINDQSANMKLDLATDIGMIILHAALQNPNQAVLSWYNTRIGEGSANAIGYSSLLNGFSNGPGGFGVPGTNAWFNSAKKNGLVFKPTFTSTSMPAQLLGLLFTNPSAIDSSLVATGELSTLLGQADWSYFQNSLNSPTCPLVSGASKCICTGTNLQGMTYITPCNEACGYYGSEACQPVLDVQALLIKAMNS